MPDITNASYTLQIPSRILTQSPLSPLTNGQEVNADPCGKTCGCIRFILLLSCTQPTLKCINCGQEHTVYVCTTNPADVPTDILPPSIYYDPSFGALRWSYSGSPSTGFTVTTATTTTNDS